MPAWMKWMIASLFLLILGGVVLVSSLESDSTTRYENYEAALKDESNGIPKGWVPEQLPRSAYEIEETHDVSSPELAHGTFRFKPEDRTGFFQTCKKVDAEVESFLGTSEDAEFYFCDAPEEHRRWCFEIDIADHDGEFRFASTAADCKG